MEKDIVRIPSYNGFKSKSKEEIIKRLLDFDEREPDKTCYIFEKILSFLDKSEEI